MPNRTGQGDEGTWNALSDIWPDGKWVKDPNYTPPPGAVVQADPNTKIKPEIKKKAPLSGGGSSSRGGAAFMGANNSLESAPLGRSVATLGN